MKLVARWAQVGAGGRAEFAEIAENLRDAVRREPEDFRLDRQRRKRAGDFFYRTAHRPGKGPALEYA